ncbi:MAG: hypothetical protein AB1522_06850 [Chloroflexota bacterium]
MTTPKEENELRIQIDNKETISAPVLPVDLDLDEETIQILLDDQIATGG